MELTSELDVLLLAVSHFGRSRGDALGRAELLREELNQLEATLAEIEQSESALANRLRAIIVRSGLVHKDEIDESLDLEALETLALERISRASDESLPDNVVVLPFDQPNLLGWKRFGKKDEQSVSVQPALLEVLATLLTQREVETLQIIFGIGTEDGKDLTGRQIFTQEFAANQLGVSQTTVSRNFRKALRKLRHPSRSEIFRNSVKAMDNEQSAIREENLLIAVFSF
jgi:hypothetical protein